MLKNVISQYKKTIDMNDVNIGNILIGYVNRSDDMKPLRIKLPKLNVIYS